MGTRNPEIINSVTTSFTRDNEALANLLLQIQYFYRGGMSREDVWAMSPGERDLTITFLEGRFKEWEKMQKNGITTFL